MSEKCPTNFTPLSTAQIQTKQELDRLLLDGLKCITPNSGIPAASVFEQIDKDFGFAEKNKPDNRSGRQE